MDSKDFTAERSGRAVLSQSGFYTFIPAALPPAINWDSALVSALAEAERDLGQLAGLAEAFPFTRLLIQPFIHNEAVLSSRIEGTRASFADVYAFETTQLSFLERVDDVREVFNYVRAVDYGMERLKAFPVSLRLIREIHAILLENARGAALTPGEFRRSQNWIGPAGSTPSTAPYVPPPVEEMHQALDALEKFIHSDTKIPALARAAMIHYQLEAIHPFLDGNGRVGRLLIILLLCEWGLLAQPVLNLSVYIEHYRQQYYDLLLGVSQKGDWEAWLAFFFRGVSEQARDGVYRIGRLREIREGYQRFAVKERNPARMAAVIDFLFARPILSVKQVADELGMPFKTAGLYLEKLVQAGVLRETTGQARNRVFRADEILGLF